MGPAFVTQAETLAPGYAGHANFLTQWGLASINADLAYGNVELLKGASAAPGAGVTIGFIDTGIDDQHPVFAGKTINEQLLTGASQETGAKFSHGTAVASLAAGGRIGGSDAAHGVAWGADIAMFAIPAGTGDNVYNPVSLASLASANSYWDGLLGTALGWRDGARKVDILNLSVGYNGLIDIYSEADLRANFATTIALIAQAGSTDKTIFVWSAGNANGDDCQPSHANCVGGKLNAVSVEILPGLVARIAELQGHSVAVAALSSNGEITSFSNRCGIASAFCIAAPGEDMTLAYFGPDSMNDPTRGYRTGRGTSYAAPVVAGGLAVMRQLFRDQLSNPELVTRLFATADKAGIYATSSIYGQGKMDLGAATSPVGVLEVPILFGTTTAVHASLDSTGLRLGAAFGDGLAEALDGGEFMALDDFGAPFWYGLGNFAATTDGPSLAARLPDLPGARIHPRVGAGGRRRGRIGVASGDPRDDRRRPPDADRGRERAPRARRGRGDGERLRSGRPLGDGLHHRTAAAAPAGDRSRARLAAGGVSSGLYRRLDRRAADHARELRAGSVRGPVGRNGLRRHRRGAGPRGLADRGGRRVRGGEPGGPGRHDPGDLPARDQHLRGPREPGVRRPRRAALVLVAAAAGGKRVGLAHGAGGPHEAR